MELTAEVLLEVLRSLRTDAPAAQMRRRRLPRVGVRLRLTILPCRDRRTEAGAPAECGEPVIVRLRNLSRRGLGFIHNQPLQLGQPFIITLPSERGGHVRMLGRVERCRTIDSGTYDIGCSIRTDVPREEIDYFLSGLRRSA